MLCIFAFVIFLIFFPILGFFPEYRVLFRKSWSCTFNKVTGQPCDINLGQELKGKLLGKMIFKYPKFTKFIDKTFSFWAFLFVAINIWSLIYVMVAGVNLYVWGTCNPVSGESCSLSGEACGAGTSEITFEQAWKKGDLGSWAFQPLDAFGKTLQQIPNRTKNWVATDYLASKPTYYKGFQEGKPTAVEFIDPGCIFCKNLFNNIKESGFKDRYNLTYNLYPIPDSKTNTGYKFQSSQILAKTIEAAKEFPLEKNGVSGDWLILEKLYEKTNEQNNLQDKFNYTYTGAEIPDRIIDLLKSVGYSQEEAKQIQTRSESKEVQDRLDYSKKVFQEKVNSVRIPTIIFNGRRYDSVVPVDQLK